MWYMGVCLKTETLGFSTILKVFEVWQSSTQTDVATNDHKG